MNFATLNISPSYNKSSSPSTSTIEDFSTGNEVTTVSNRDSDEKGLEVRLTSPDDFLFNWIAGFVWYKSKDKMDNNSDDGSFDTIYNLQKIKAAYANITYPISSRFRATVGARLAEATNYNYEDRYPYEDASGGGTSASGTSYPKIVEMTYDKPDYKFGIEYDLRQNSMLYADTSSSYRTHASIMDADGNPFPPERLRAFNLGVKSRFFGNKLQHMGLFNGGHVQIDQPDAKTYDIFDQNTIAAAFTYQKCIEAGKCTDERFAQVPDGISVFPDAMDEIQSDLKKNSAGIIQADTLEELADKIGVNKKNFLETVKKYNECCSKGVDLEYFKEKDYLAAINKAPYYASSASLSTDGAFGGVRMNPEMQAYRSDRKTLVEGLYVTGDFATGRHINLGTVKTQVLNDLSWAFSSGFLAGTNVAEYLLDGI